MDRFLLRLSDEERGALKILNAALKVSEYTDDVDNIRSYQRADKMSEAMLDLFQSLAGLSLVSRTLPRECEELMEKYGRKPAVFAPLLGPIFEIGRRFKRQNPDRMRSEYGKLVMLLQDSRSPKMEARLGMNSPLVLPLKTVGSALNSIGASAVLESSKLKVATEFLTADGIKARGDDKDKARKSLIEEFGADDPVKRELVERCIRSIDDANMFVASNLAVIDQLKLWLKDLFQDQDGTKYSLAIRSGSNGSCLSHSHRDHLQYVLESLTLWGIIQRDIFDFWEVVEEDMIGAGAGSYRFCDTGQGFHRVCSGPKTYARMQSALREARNAMGGWVGTSVVHLGDNDVPNALVFIDKYTIIPKLLSPIVHTICEIDKVFAENHESYPGLRNLLKAKYGTGEKLKMDILCDFFKHGFDGSGDDGGSCIDGRLTSAWNWTSLLHKKPYYDAFVLTGFTGFDAAYS